MKKFLLCFFLTTISGVSDCVGKWSSSAGKVKYTHTHTHTIVYIVQRTLCRDVHVSIFVIAENWK